MPKVDYTPERIYKALGVDTPKKWQLDFLENDDVEMLVGERQTGKTTALMAKVVDKILDASPRNQVEIAFVCQARMQSEAVRNVLFVTLRNLIGSVTLADRVIYGENCKIKFFTTSDEYSMAGQKYDLVILDECEILDDMSYVYRLGDRRIASYCGTKPQKTIWAE